MSLYVQHGHGKGDRIVHALEDGSVDGVIIGARNESPEQLPGCIEALRNAGKPEILFDPQYYVSTFIPPNDRFLPRYPYYEAARTASDFVKSSRIQQVVSETLEFEHHLGVDRLVSPTVLCNSLNDRWYQVALNLADASLEFVASRNDLPPLLLSFLISETALEQTDAIEGFLNTITQWDMDGVYLIISREERSYSQRYGEQRLANLLYMVYSLATRNNYRVVCGYSDFVGLLLAAVGAKASATGWFQSLRHFHRGNFQVQAGGGSPRYRYSSAPLFNSILLSELHTIYEIGDLDHVLSRVPLDEIMLKAPGPEAADGWTHPVSERHHWQVLNAIGTSLTEDCSANLDRMTSRLSNADALYSALEAKGMVFSDQTSGRHLGEWMRAISIFRQQVPV